jgi:peptidoglycan/LPS O-acetylase OafA/YrhL
MFLVGIFFQQNFKVLHKYLSGKIVYLLPLYLLFSYLAVDFGGWQMRNEINPIHFFALSLVIFSAAYSYPKLGKNILRGNDISYGVYIYHIPVINLFMYYGYISNSHYILLVLLFTIILATLSWLIIEKNSLKFKKYSIIQ